MSDVNTRADALFDFSPEEKTPTPLFKNSETRGKETCESGVGKTLCEREITRVEGG